MSKNKNTDEPDHDLPPNIKEVLKDPERAKTLIMITAIELGISPLEYSLFSQQYKAFGTNSFSEGADDDIFPFEVPIMEVHPIPEADKKTLRLRIQLRDIKKPPLWREVEIPADYNFRQLHEVIQRIFGWTNSHLWQFERKPYNEICIISEDDNAEYDPSETPVTGFLKNIGDKFIYLYDFGDDWIHDIKVLDVEDRVIPYPTLLKWKGDNPIEDCGGAWGYQELRDAYANKDSMSKKEQKEFLDNSWFDTMDDFALTMNDQKLNPDEVNEELKKLGGGK
ncbi:MAG: plasmid pRiA4b ORF-3 family protein [Bacteroides sp.]|nr:plasmid pRiA4b ORF-3 family protein [Bacteroides sp.]